MGIERKPTRYAHSDGHTDVCYSEDGGMLVTCGTDGDIRIWSGFEDDDPVQTCVGEWSLCVRQKGQHLMVATDNNNVQLLSYPEGERDAILSKFTAPVNHMAVSKDQDLVAIACEALEIKLMPINGTKEDDAIKSFKGLSGPPLSIAMCPKGKLLAASAGDGFLRVWDIESQDLLKEFNCVAKVNSFASAKTLCRIDFHPVHGRYLAYPEKSNIVVINTSDWSVKQTLSCGAIEEDYTIVQFSPCGEYVAAATIRGDIVIWNFSTDTLIDVTVNPKSIPICAMVWNPKGNGEIAFCDTNGQLGIATKCNVSSDSNEPETAIDNEFTSDVGIEDDDEDNENAVSLEKLKKEILGSPSQKDDDERSISLPPSPRPRTPEEPLQSIFMPTSTPEHLNPRYLCWNEVGVIRCYGSVEDDDPESGKSIEVEFHDSTFHNSIMVPNFHNYTMGTVSTSCLVVANSTQATVIPLSSGTKDWNITLNEDEELICIACSSTLVCIATNNNLIRVFTPYGIQKAVFCVPGPMVTMSAFNSFLIIAYHSAAPRKNDQCIDMILVNLDGNTVEKKDLQSALTPETSLHWLGFTDMGNPASMDTYGMLCVYPLKSNIWMPFCDTTKHRSSPLDHFFVTAVYESLSAVRGIRCRGGMYPGFTPRPTQMELQLQPPFIEMTTEKSQLEANLFMWSTLQVENSDKKFKETALKCFALACKNNLDQRAYELIEILAVPQILNLATKYASKLDRKRLAEKLMTLASKLEVDEEDTQTEEEAVSTPNNLIKPLSRKIVLSSKSIKSRNSLKYNNTPQESTNGNQNDSLSVATPESSKLNSLDTSTNTQNSTLSEDEPKNPFLKSSKKNNPAYNPLSLTDKFAGYTIEKENKNIQKEGEKRKQPETEITDKQKEKQRKLDKFMFSKRN